MNFEFRKTMFENSHLDLILVESVKVWKSNEWIKIKNFSSFDKLLIDNNSNGYVKVRYFNCSLLLNVLTEQMSKNKLYN